jgi:primosomal protein N' (replication factor Y)
LYLEGSIKNFLKEGLIVKVPLGKRVVNGCILETNLKEEECLISFDVSKIKEIKEIHPIEISLSNEYLKFIKWVSNYYHYPLGMLIFDILPKPLKRARKLRYIEGEDKQLPFDLNDKQLFAVDKISKNLFSGYSKWLVHGVTGSGKSAIYITLMKQVLKKNRTVLFLLPEINLTPQFLDFFKKHLDAPIYSYNSTISDSDRFGLWKELLEDDSPKVIVGVRSSIFLPIRNLGLVVVDEEHDSSFKQEGHCPYNARDMALKLGSLIKIPVLLGSATPSVESFHSFKNSFIDNYIPIENRVGDSNLPEVILHDSRKDSDEYWPLTSKSVEELRKVLDRGEQVLVFINRLGYSTYLQCRSCGHTFSCPNCSVNLKYFQSKKQIRCNYCDYKDSVPEICPECSNLKIFKKGFGTEKVQEVLSSIFPEKNIERFDRDEITTMKKLEVKLNRFHGGKIDILVGTQMLSKGHNFHRVNLVLILGIDAQLNRPDFRSNERVYQLLTQVSGRSGRFSKKSAVIIQTLNPDDGLFSIVKDHSFDRFYQEDLSFREIFSCPPYSKVVMIYLSLRFVSRVAEDSRNIVNGISKLKESHFQSLKILGPRPALIERKVNKYTWSIMLTSLNINELHNTIKTLKCSFSPSTGVSIQYDVDPYSIN